MLKRLQNEATSKPYLAKRMRRLETEIDHILPGFKSSPRPRPIPAMKLWFYFLIFSILPRVGIAGSSSGSLTLDKFDFKIANVAATIVLEEPQERPIQIALCMAFPDAMPHIVRYSEVQFHLFDQNGKMIKVLPPDGTVGEFDDAISRDHGATGAYHVFASSTIHFTKARIKWKGRIAEVNLISPRIEHYNEAGEELY